MKRYFLPLLFVCGLLGGAAWYLLWPVSVVISLNSVESVLDDYLAQKSVNWNNLMRLQLSHPKLSAAPDNRLRIDVSGDLKPAMFGAYQGQLVLETGLMYKPEQGEFFLQEPQLQNLTFADLPVLYTDPLKQMANQLLPPIFAQVPVYRLNPDQLPERALKKMLMAVSVQDNQIKIVFQNRYLHQLLSEK